MSSLPAFAYARLSHKQIRKAPPYSFALLVGRHINHPLVQARRLADISSDSAYARKKRTTCCQMIPDKFLLINTIHCLIDYTASYCESSIESIMHLSVIYKQIKSGYEIKKHNPLLTT